VQNFIDLGTVHHIYVVKNLEVIKVTPCGVTFESVNFEMILAQVHQVYEGRKCPNEKIEEEKLANKHCMV